MKNLVLVPALAFFVSLSSLACVAHASAAPPPPSPASKGAAAPAPTAFAAPPSSSSTSRASDTIDRPVYRFDFVLTTREGAAPATTSNLTLTLEEGQHGELMVGKNVMLTVAPDTGAPVPGGANAPRTAFGPRQDVGLKIQATFRSVGSDVLLQVESEASTVVPPSTIQKVTTRGNAIATPGKSAVVATLDDATHHWQLAVTPTRVH